MLYEYINSLLEFIVGDIPPQLDWLVYIIALFVGLVILYAIFVLPIKIAFSMFWN